jgi:membrane peptidoglycan carboxypeptidase
MSAPAPEKLPANKVASHLGVMLLVSVVLGVVVSGLAIPFAGVLGLSAQKVAEGVEELPAELETDLLAQRTTIADINGETIATIYDQNRLVIPLHQISPRMIEAILAIEDYRFYQHGALDVRGTLRALATNRAANDVVQGGSSITQQLVKLTLIERADGDRDLIRAAQEDTYARKINELRYAIALEKKYSKNWILERYLNVAYFGNGAYGVQSAARTYFNVDAKDLNLNQSAMLAGLVQSPSRYAPTNNRQRARERRNVVLDRMAQLGAVDRELAERVKQRGMGLDLQEMQNGCADSQATFFCEYALEYLMQDSALGETREDRRRLLRRGGLTIQTTVDMRMQNAADAAVRRHVNPTDNAIGAIALVEPGSGEVRALAQSRPQGNGAGQTYINYTVPKKYGDANGFQPGSSMKTFVLAAAVKQGIPLNKTYSAQAPATFRQGDFETCDGPYRSNQTWTVRNSTSSSANPNLYEGTQQSVNTFFARLELDTGICMPWRMARQMGIRSLRQSDQIPSFVLGVADVSPLDMAGAYATFAARGRHCAARPVLSISDANGNELKTYDPECRRIMSQEEADAVNDVLDGVVAPSGFGRNLMPGVPAAGKTGTSQANRAVWFAGYTPDLSGAAVVAGVNSAGQPVTLNRQVIGGQFRSVNFGSTTAGPIWGDTYKAIAQHLSGENFVKPGEEAVHGVQVVVPRVSGMSVERATEVLEDAGFEVRTGSRWNSTVSRGLVAGTSPGGGARHGQGLTVTIHTSTGRSQAEVDRERRAEEREREREENRDRDDDDDDEPPGRGRNPERADSTASGRPTYPSPMTPTIAEPSSARDTTRIPLPPEPLAGLMQKLFRPRTRCATRVTSC